MLHTLRITGLLATFSVLSACGGGSSGDPGEEEVPITDITHLPAARNILPELARSEASFEGVHYSGSDACSTCHNDPDMVVSTAVKDVTRDVSIGTAWETSMMANATRDPYWHAVVAAELDNFPGLEDTINDKCIVCHAPMAHDLAEKEGLDLRLFDKVSEVDGSVIQQGLYSMTETDELFNHAMDGVSCSLCHQMDGTNLGTEASMSGGYEVVGSVTGDNDDRPAYGQYADPEVGYMRQNAGFLAQQGLHLSTSESCATCHNLNVHAVSEEGLALEGDAVFAEQAVYSEWENSDYAVGGPKEANCQSCHMPKLDEEVIIGQNAPGKRPDFAEHTFLGANTVVQDMLMNFGDELGVKPGMDFAGSIARNREFLKTAATVTLTEGGVIDNTLSFDVNIENNTGHRLPSGYHSRRVYLHVQVLDSSGEQVFESGKIRADGSIVGVSEDVDPATWEIHYQTITSETQVQVYQAITGNSDGDRTHSVLASSFYLKDNRLTPAGMDKNSIRDDNTLPDTFGVFGVAMDDDSDFNNGKDTVTYRVSVPGSDIYTVSAELRYQPISYGHLLDLWTQSETVDQVDMFRTIYDGTTLRDEVIDTSSQIMQ
ncbi:cytochrome c family protein [Granulosicoccus antarcticus]|uniref:cytochrome c family protein n=1 Tax=Granulosicoccus antarcticus TaxID=437505 RepID=UPI001F1A78CC|nr:cytochrome c family protein [Granulosicoccus antarcticus]